MVKPGILCREISFSTQLKSIYLCVIDLSFLWINWSDMFKWTKRTKRQIQAPRKKMQNAVLTQIFFLWVVFPNLIQIVEKSFKGCWWTFLPASTSVHVLVVVVVVVIVVVVVVIVVVVVVVDVDSVDHGEDSVGHREHKGQKTKGGKLSVAAWGRNHVWFEFKQARKARRCYLQIWNCHPLTHSLTD